MKRKILYLMHVDWGWIKQRPHFIAEGLVDKYSLTICYVYSYRRGMLAGYSKPQNANIKRIFLFPFSRFAVIERINKWVFNSIVKYLSRSNDIIWITHPSLFSGLSEVASKKDVIYDCMDDCLKFSNVSFCPKKENRIWGEELELIKHASHIFVSSDYLRDVIVQRYKRSHGVKVVNNGIKMPLESGRMSQIVNSPQVEYVRSISGCKVLYFGTISDWFDFSILEGSLGLSDKLNYILVGPREVEGPKHPRIHYLPPVEHREVFNMMQECDALVMPFILNDLVKSVNPVKVYEYIFSGKPAIVLSYGETIKFSKYVHLYSDVVEFNGLIAKVVSHELGEKSPRELTLQYLDKCSWKERVNDIIGTIEKSAV
jgi:teichuronic acid biosynthesis glycosyltransferase TuaH